MLELREETKNSQKLIESQVTLAYIPVATIKDQMNQRVEEGLEICEELLSSHRRAVGNLADLIVNVPMALEILKEIQFKVQR